MDKCTRPVKMIQGKYVLCGDPAKYCIGSWDVCENCKSIADYYTKKYAVKGETDEKTDS